MGWFGDKYFVFIADKLNIEKVKNDKRNGTLPYSVDHVQDVCLPSNPHFKDNEYILSIHGEENISYISLSFDSISGNFKEAIVYYNYRRNKNNQIKLSPKELKEQREKEIRLLLEQFVNNARSMKYLI